MKTIPDNEILNTAEGTSTEIPVADFSNSVRVDYGMRSVPAASRVVTTSGNTHQDTDRFQEPQVQPVLAANNVPGETDVEVPAAPIVKTKDKKEAAKTVLSWFIVLAIAVCAALFVRTFLLTPYEIPSGSMEHTLEIDDHVFAEKVSYMFGSPKQGDIVTFLDPEFIDKKFPRTLIKRVVATEGQTVNLVDGYVYVDGVKQDQDYIVGESYPLDSHMEGKDVTYPYTVPEGEIWVMGDNRENSLDSRFFGSVPVDTVTGHAIVTYWPLDRIGILGS